MKFWSEAQEKSMANWAAHERKMVDLAATAYIKVMGWDKWNSLTDKEKHDGVMMMLEDFSARLA